MKKTIFKGILLCIFSFLPTLNSNAQDIRVGLHGGFPTGDVSDFSSFNLGADAAIYFWEATDWLNVGVATGYTHFFGKDISGVKADDFGYIPVAASGRGTFNYGLFYTADIGYGIGTNNADGGLYYQGKFGWSNNKVDVFAFYRGISADNIDVASLGVGVAFKVH